MLSEQQQQQGADDQQGGDDDGDPPVTVEALASEMGWVPQEKYTGKPEEWKPADQFIRDGRDIQRGYARELKEIRGTIDVMSRTSAAVMADQLKRQRDELTDRYNQQVEDGDAAGSFKTAQEISALESREIQVKRAGPSSAGQEFAERHSSWFQKDPVATARAVAICNEFAALGRTEAEQLAAAERTIRAEYPEHFKGQQNGSGQQRQAPQVHRPGGRSGGSGSGKGKGFADMPKQAQDVANDMFKRGVIPDVKQYVEKYWQMMEGNA